MSRPVSAEAFHLEGGELHVENVPLAAIAARFGTPCYVYSRNALTAAFREFDDAFAGVPHLVCYAMKAPIDAVTTVAGPVTDGTVIQHAPDDVGGLLDTSKGWTLNIPAPGEGDSAAAKLIAQQKGALAQAPTQVAAAGPAGPAVASR